MTAPAPDAADRPQHTAPNAPPERPADLPDETATPPAAEVAPPAPEPDTTRPARATQAARTERPEAAAGSTQASPEATAQADPEATAPSRRDPSPPPPPLKPRLRGWLHAGMFPAALVSGVVLTALADSPRGRIACAVYTLTACALFGVSALYHRGSWGPRGTAVLRRLDHANIFLIIAGTYTPFTLLLLPNGDKQLLLWLVWAGALAGIAFRVFWVGAPRWLYTPCYIALGWAALFFLPDFLRTGGIAVLVLIVVGGLLYSAGAVVYGTKRPNPSPRWFGFHEVFHSFTLAAFVVHYVGISLVAYQHP